MKCAVFLLLAGLCLTVVAANGGAFVQPQPFEIDDFEYLPQDLAEEVADADTFGAFGLMYFVIRSALRTLKGVHCTLVGVVDMRNAAQKFIDDVNACGGTVSKQLQTVINSCKAIISTCNDIINLNSNLCNNDSEDTANSGKKTPYKCFRKLLSAMLTLKKQISKTIGQIKKIPEVPGQVGACLQTAKTDLTTVFMTFPSFVKTCSKLKS